MWRVVHGPSVEAEDQRHRRRDLETLKQDRASTTTCIKGLLRSQGRRLTSLSQLPEQLETRRRWDGSPIPRGWRRRVLRVYAPQTGVREQMAAREAERRERLRNAQEANSEQVRQGRHLRGIGINGAWWVVMALFGWCAWQNRRERGG